MTFPVSLLKGRLELIQLWIGQGFLFLEGIRRSIDFPGQHTG